MSCTAPKCVPTPKEIPERILQSKVSPKIVARMQDMVLDNATLRKEMGLYLDNVNRGLKKATNPTAVIKCYPTYVQDLPDGTEKGKYFALDLGGTNFRVLLVTLDGPFFDMEFANFEIPKDLMVGSGKGLFDHIAKCLAEFAQTHKVANDNLPLGFTFSFPLTQTGLCAGRLKKWTKGFKCDDVVNQDPVQWLMEAINRRHDVKIDVCAVLNDTTGTLLACAWKNRYCRIGLIVGTGSNACYLEKIPNVELYDEPDRGSGNVIINLEMGAFGEDGCLDFIRTAEDRVVDEHTLNKGQQIHEKMVAGMYLGEIVRLRTLTLINEGLMFDQEAKKVFEQKDIFTSEMISLIEEDLIGEFKHMEPIFQQIGLHNTTVQQKMDFRYICQTVSRRSAHLIASSMSVLVEKIGEPYIVIGIDGSVYKNHPQFRRLMAEKMRELVKPGCKFNLMLSEDGSGRGAALVAAVAAKTKH